MKFWWFLITVPLLAGVIYYIGNKISKKVAPNMNKKMLGISILSICLGISQMAFGIIKYPAKGLYIIFGLLWILLGTGRILYDFRK